MIERLQRPTPRIELGRRLIGLARSAIDLSDGLIGDLGHVLRRSGVAARVEWDKVPRSATLRALGESDQQRLALAGGDDYELLFSVPPGQHRQGRVDRGPCRGHRVKNWPDRSRQRTDGR